MDVIELECPHCGDALELDAAFAGGVCRCSTCGTLMTVPADPSRERAETVTRRERPAAPTGRPDVPRAPAPRPDSPSTRAARPDVPGGRPETPGARPESPGGPAPADLAALAGAAPPGSSASSQGAYFTSSGKSLELAEAVVPTARKRKKVIGATVIAAFAAMAIGLIVVIIVAINFVLNAANPTDDSTVDTVGVDPAVNPLKKTEANLITVAIAGECAIVVDATMFAGSWYPMMRDIIGHEVSLASSTNFMVIPWTDLNPKSFPAKPEKVGRDKISELDSSLNVSNLGTEINPTPFVELALAERADQIILVSGRKLGGSEINSLKEAIAKRVDVHLDVVVIGYHDPALQALAKENKGRYVSVKTEQLQKWYDEWKKGG